jgi:large subunit ribosomal protein L4
MSEKAKVTKDALKAQLLSAADLGLNEAQKKIATPEQFSVEVRRLLQNWRQGTVASKGRSDVVGSTRKPWKQKGTGRARAGDVKSPIWRGGGVVFGPQKRTRTLKTNKQSRKALTRSLLWNALDKKTIYTLDWSLETDVPKTKQAVEAFKKANLSGTQINLFLSSNDFVTAASFANIPWVRIIFFDSANAYDLADAFRWVVLKKDLESFKGMVAQWI